VSTQLNWDVVTWTPNGALTQSYAIGPGNVNFTFGGQTDRLVNSTPQRGNTLTGGLTPAQYGLYVRTDHNSTSSDQITITIAFTHPGGVTGVAFSIFDVDESGSHIDDITVTATDGVSTFNPSSVVDGSCVSFNGTNTVTGTCSSGNTSANGNARFTFNQANLTSVSIIYRNTIGLFNPGVQEINLHDISFSYYSADLALAKVVSNPTPTAGDDVTFTLTASNTAGDSATSVTVGDLLPSGFTWVSDTGGGNYVPGTGVWTVGTIASGGSAVLSITATVEAVGTYVNVAEVTAAGASDPDSTPNNGAPGEDDRASVTVTRSPLAVIKRSYQPDGTAIPNGTAMPQGSLVQFLLYVNNRAGNVADVSIRDVLDPLFAYVPGSMRFTTTTACALATCTGAEEAAIRTAAAAGTVGTDPVNADVVSSVGGTVDAGNGSVANAQLDVPADRVWALVFTAQVQ
jgi:uncharacterized repeat protein (TIGR01451 family)